MPAGRHDSEGFPASDLGPHYDIRLGDLQAYHRLWATCPKCRHSAWLTPEFVRRRRIRYFTSKGMWSRSDDELIEIVNRARLIELEPALRCTMCRNKRGNSWRARTVLVQTGR